MGPVQGERLKSGCPAAPQALSGNVDLQCNNALSFVVVRTLTVEPTQPSKKGVQLTFHLLHTLRHWLLSTGAYDEGQVLPVNIPGEHVGANKNILLRNQATEFMQNKTIQVQSWKEV